MNKAIVIALAVALICTHCTETEEDKILATDQCRNNNQARLCTANLAFIPIYVLDQSGNPIALDRFTVTNGDNYYTEKMPSEANWNDGRYVIFSDNEAEFIEVGGSRFLFRGIARDKTVVSETYTIGYDCCHVFLLSGNDTIRIGV